MPGGIVAPFRASKSSCVAVNRLTMHLLKLEFAVCSLTPIVEQSDARGAQFVLVRRVPIFVLAASARVVVCGPRGIRRVQLVGFRVVAGAAKLWGCHTPSSSSSSGRLILSACASSLFWLSNQLTH